MAQQSLFDRILNNKIRSGTILLALGLVALAGTGFFEPYTASTTSANTGAVGESQNIEYSMSGEPALFSSVSAGGEYEWDMTVENTGDVTWDTLYITSRITTPDAEVVKTTSDNVNGEFYVGGCSTDFASVVDDPACREDLGEWSWSTTGGDSHTSEIGGDDGTDTIATVTFDDTSIEPGDTKTATISVSVPDDYEGGSAMITQPVANVAGQGNTVAGDYDTMEQGDISGTTTLQFLGAVGAASGAVLLALGLA